MLAPRFLPTLLALTCTATLPAAEIVVPCFSPGNAEAVVVRTIEESKRDLLGAAYSKEWRRLWDESEPPAASRREASSTQ